MSQAQGQGQGQGLFPVPPPQFDFSHGEESKPRDGSSEVDDQVNPFPPFISPTHQLTPSPSPANQQIDWIGTQLSQLIEQGKRALGREVVVMSDAKEDEVDDGSGAWVDDGFPSHSRGGGKRPRPRSREVGVPSYGQNWDRDGGVHYRSRSYEGYSQSVLSTPQPLSSRSADFDFGAGTGTGASNEREREWESPEMRESMEKARARFHRYR